MCPRGNLTARNPQSLRTAAPSEPSVPNNFLHGRGPVGPLPTHPRSSPSGTKIKHPFMGALFLCPREDSNLHALRRYHLKVVRLPFRHPGYNNFPIISKTYLKFNQKIPEGIFYYFAAFATFMVLPEIFLIFSRAFLGDTSRR